MSASAVGDQAYDTGKAVASTNSLDCNLTVSTCFAELYTSSSTTGTLEAVSAKLTVEVRDVSG